MFNVSYRVIERIRRNNNIYHSYTKQLTKEESAQILKYMQNNPLIPYTEMIEIFGCTYKQLTRIRSGDKSLPSLMKTTVRKKHNIFLTSELENALTEFMKENADCTYDDITTRFPNCSVRQIERVRKDHKFPPIKRRPSTTRQSILKKEGKRYCPQCDTIKLLSDFPKYRLSCCYDCEVKRTAKRVGENDIDRYFETKIKQSIKRPNIKNTITVEDLHRVYAKQSGKCFYSNRIMEFRTNHPNSLSIDRIDSSKGYHFDNIVMCCSVVNYMKQEYNVDDFLLLCNQIADTHPTKAV